MREFRPGQHYLFFLTGGEGGQYRLMAPEEQRIVRIDQELLPKIKRLPSIDNAWERVVAILETVVEHQPDHLAARLLLHDSPTYQTSR